MRNYLARIELTEKDKTLSTGLLGETLFERWHCNNYQGEVLHRQLADNDYKGVDFIDNKGIKYQVKGSRGATFTFNCSLELLKTHLRADVYICIQIKEKVAYIEFMCDANNILDRAKESFQFENSCFVWAKDLQQYKINL